MSKRVEFFFDFGSPTAYLAWSQLPRICQAHQAELIYRPMLLGGVFKATGNQSPVMIAAKGRYMHQDMQRYATRYGVTLNMNPYFPINTLYLMRAASAVALYEPARLEAFIKTIYEAMWVQALNMGKISVLNEVLEQAGFDPQSLLAQIEQPEVKAALIATTDEAIARGVFGAPTVFVGDEMFFGQDRLDFIAQALENA